MHEYQLCGSGAATVANNNLVKKNLKVYNYNDQFTVSCQNLSATAGMWARPREEGLSRHEAG